MLIICSRNAVYVHVLAYMFLRNEYVLRVIQHNIQCSEITSVVMLSAHGLVSKPAPCFLWCRNVPSYTVPSGERRQP